MAHGAVLKACRLLLDQLKLFDSLITTPKLLKSLREVDDIVRHRSPRYDIQGDAVAYKILLFLCTEIQV